MSDRPTPETDALCRAHQDDSFDDWEKYRKTLVFARKLERERDEAREALSSISLYLSVGMGDETTTAQQYEQRILDGIKMLAEPIAKLWKQAEKERDEAREALMKIEHLFIDGTDIYADREKMGTIAKEALDGAK